MSDIEKRDERGYLFNIDFVAYIDILKKQIWFIVVFCLAAVLTSLALTYILTEKYDAATTMYYRPLESSLLRQKTTESFGAPPPAPPFKVINQTLRDMIRSPLILEPVVKKLHMDEDQEVYYDTWYERWYNEAKDSLMDYYAKTKMILQYGRIIEEDPLLSAISELAENIDITATKDSYIYVLKVRDKHPKRATLIVDLAGKELVTWIQNQDRTIARKSSGQFAEQLREKDKELKNLRKKREGLLNKYTIVSVSDEASQGTESQYQMELERVKLKADIEEKQKVIASLNKEIKSKKYINPDDFKRLESEKLFNEIDRSGLIAKMNSLNSSIDSLKKKFHELPALEKSIDGIDMNIASVEREREQYKDLYLEAMVETTSLQSEIKILHDAVTTGAPAQPIKIYHVGLAALLSLCLSVGMVYVFAFFNIRIFFSSMGADLRTAPRAITADNDKKDA